jgi:hypothetical protein
MPPSTVSTPRWIASRNERPWGLWEAPPSAIGGGLELGGMGRTLGPCPPARNGLGALPLGVTRALD